MEGKLKAGHLGDGQCSSLGHFSFWTEESVAFQRLVSEAGSGEVMEIWSFGKACVSPLTSSACTVTLRGQQQIQQNYGTYLKKDR